MTRPAVLAFGLPAMAIEKAACQNQLSAYQTDLATIFFFLGGGGVGPLCVFVKCFTKILKVKSFRTFSNGFYNQRKIFYGFDHIFHANKYMKMGKNVT